MIRCFIVHALQFTWLFGKRLCSCLLPWAE